MASALIALAFVISLSEGVHAAYWTLAEITPSGDRVLPAITFETEGGQQLTLADQEGRLTVLHFWSTWCAPCVEELPELDKMYQEYRQRGVQVIPISLDGAANAGKVREFYQANKIDALPMYFGNQLAFMKDLDLAGLPTTIFIKEGKEIGRANGTVTWGGTQVRKWLDDQLHMDAAVP